ncbi:MAG: glycosyltransferase, partial [Thermoplasmata archaeon]
IRDLERPGLSPHLLVIGDGPLLGPIKERLANCGLEDTVHFLGRVEDPWVAISACDIYTHISKRESLSISILEAMSVGKPVIATDVGGTREILSDESHGLTVDPHLRDMKAMLLSLSNDKERMRQLALNARRRVETTFSRRLSAMNHLRLYGEALRRNQE